MFRTLLRATASLAVGLVTAFTATPVVAVVPTPVPVSATTGTHHALLADVAERARFLAQYGDRTGANIMRAHVLLLDDRGTHGVAGSLA